MLDVERIVETLKPQQRARVRVASGDIFSTILDTEVAKANQDLQHKDAWKEKDETIDKHQEDFNPQVLAALIQPEYKKVPEEKKSGTEQLSTTEMPRLSSDTKSKEALAQPMATVAQGMQSIVLQGKEGELLITAGMSVKDIQGILAKKMTSAPAMSFDQLYENLVREMTSKKTGALKLRLEPKDLGTIDVYFTLDKNSLSIAFAANEQTKKLLQESQDDLLKQLHRQPGYEQTALNFASYDTREHRSFDQKFGDSEQKNDYEMLNITSKEDILSNIQTLFSDMVVNYVA
jgi:flagellar hook-length control protein FliK